MCLMTQTLWQKKPKRMRITVDGKLSEGLGAKDIALAIIANIGADGASGHAIEFAGSAIRALSMEGRMTLCNMAIEAGGRCGIVAPDATTFDYLKGREFAPKGEALDKAMQDWIELKSDAGAQFDREVSIDATAVAPFVTWGTSPEDALPIDAQRSRPCPRAQSGARKIYPRRNRLYGPLAGQEADRYRHRSRFHRLLHQCAHRGSARRGSDSRQIA